MNLKGKLYMNRSRLTEFRKKHNSIDGNLFIFLDNESYCFFDKNQPNYLGKTRKDIRSDRLIKDYNLINVNCSFWRILLGIPEDLKIE